ncbi:MAG: DsbA family protein, partial [Actinomadura rubrobrunea]|nr:DsbA family protein [Actinomadura rubrobrunea]
MSGRYYFSLRSPYSWLAHRELVERHADVLESVEWVPFFEPDELSERMLTEAGGRFIYTPMSRAKHFYVLQDVRRLAGLRGIAMTWPVDRDPVWEVPHLAYLAARRHGVGPQFVARAYRARWEEGRDICDRATMAELAADLGLPADELAGAADDAALREEGVRALLSIYRDGVFGVPFFVHGFDKYWG